MDIYKNIYETVNSNLEKNGMHFPFSEEQYLNIVRRDPYNIKISEFKEVISDSDMDAFFYRTLNRLCDDIAKYNVRKTAKDVGLELGEDMLTVIAGEVSGYKELQIKRKKIDWDMYSTEREKQLAIIRKMQREERRNLFRERVRLFKERIKLNTVIRLWECLSDDRKNKIRRLFGREEK